MHVHLLERKHGTSKARLCQLTRFWRWRRTCPQPAMIAVQPCSPQHCALMGCAVMYRYDMRQSTPIHHESMGQSRITSGRAERGLSDEALHLFFAKNIYRCRTFTRELRHAVANDRLVDPQAQRDITFQRET
eukprot:IDg1329t1